MDWACSLINNNNLFLDTNSFIIFLEEFKSHLFFENYDFRKKYNFHISSDVLCALLCYDISSFIKSH